MNRCFLVANGPVDYQSECDGNPGVGQRRVVLWGDSFAAHIYVGLHTQEQAHGDFVVAQYTSAACPPLVAFVSDARPQCPAMNRYAMDRITALKPDTVIMSANWRVYDGHVGLGEFNGTMLRDTVARLAEIGVRRIVVVGQFPVWQTDVPRLRIARYRAAIAGRALAGINPNRAVPELIKSEIAVDALLRSVLTGTSAIFVAPLATFCNDQGCLLAVPGRPDSVAADNGHLTLASSDFFVAANAQALLGE